MVLRIQINSGLMLLTDLLLGGLERDLISILLKLKFVVPGRIFQHLLVVLVLSSFELFVLLLL